MLFSREPTPSLQKKSYMYKIMIRIRKGCFSLSLSLFFKFSSLFCRNGVEETRRREKKERQTEEEEEYQGNN